MSKTFKKGDKVRTTKVYTDSLPVPVVRAFNGVVRSTNVDYLVRVYSDEHGTQMVHESWLELDPDFQEKTPELKTDYTGCHPEIAASLKRGEHIMCRHPTNHWITFLVYAYSVKDCFKYRSATNGWYQVAEPLPKTETRVVCLTTLVDRLIAYGYSQAPGGLWRSASQNATYPYNIFAMCGKGISEAQKCVYADWMLEEVEI